MLKYYYIILFLSLSLKFLLAVSEVICYMFIKFRLTRMLCRAYHDNITTESFEKLDDDEIM